MPLVADFNGHPIRSILAIQTAGIGDALLTTPALTALGHRFPGATIDTLSKGPAAEIFGRHPLVHEARILSRTLKGTWRAIAEARAKRYDLLVDFSGKARTCWVAFGAGAPWRLSHHRGRIGLRARLFNLHGVEHAGYSGMGRVGLLRPLEVPEVDYVPQFPPTEASLKLATARFQQAGIQSGDKLIAFAPSSLFISKIWPREHWIELGRKLRDELGLRIVAVEPPGDKQGVAQMASDSDGAITVFPSANLNFLAAVYQRAILTVADCSGPRHIAAAQSTPTLTLHGGSDEANWTLPSPLHQFLALEMDCRPCRQLDCRFGTTACLTELPVERVYQACLDQLKALRAL